jgi:hypothetical protein
MLGPEYHSKTKLVKDPRASETHEEVWEHLIPGSSILKVFLVKTPVSRGTNFSFFHHPFPAGLDTPQNVHPGTGNPKKSLGFKPQAQGVEGVAPTANSGAPEVWFRESVET